MTKSVSAVRIMSRTSGDGVDAVLLELDTVHDRHDPRVLDLVHVPFEPALQAELTNPTSLSLARLSELHAELPRRYADAVRRLDGWKRCSVVGMHGQTVWHGPPSAGAWSTIAGILLFGLKARNSGLNCSPTRISIGTRR